MKTIKTKGIFKISDKNKFIETLEFGKIHIAFSEIKNIPKIKNFIVSKNFAVIETENEALVVIGNNLTQFGNSLIELFRKNKNENTTQLAKEIMRGYFSEYFQSLDLKKDRKFYDFYCTKKIKPLIEVLFKKQEEEK
jgi:hypothetical protein